MAGKRTGKQGRGGMEQRPPVYPNCWCSDAEVSTTHLVERLVAEAHEQAEEAEEILREDRYRHLIVRVAGRAEEPSRYRRLHRVALELERAGDPGQGRHPASSLPGTGAATRCQVGSQEATREDAPQSTISH